MSPASRYPADLVRVTRAGCCPGPLAGDRGTLASHGRDRGQPTVDGEGRGMSVMRKLTIRRSSATLPGVPGYEPGDVVTEQPPLAYRAALRALISCVASTARLLWRGRIHLPSGHVGMRLRFADGTSARVYRETVIERGATTDPCVLVVEFKLRAVRGRGHAAFRWESLLNTPLFAGFPGLVSKLWLADDERGRYRGLYEWDGPRLAENYARALWRVLALVSVRGSIHYVVLPGLRRDELLDRPPGHDSAAAEADAWWQLADVG